jgi:hypothetical protein
MAAESGEKLVNLLVYCVSNISFGAMKVWHI